jgi:hypothetical protein
MSQRVSPAGLLGQAGPGGSLVIARPGRADIERELIGDGLVGYRDSLHADEKSAADRWLAGELNRIWLISERALRAFQNAQLRPQHGHPAVLEVETILTARRIARLGPDVPPPDDAQLAHAIEDSERDLAELRAAAPIGRLVDNLHLQPLEVETLVTVLAPHIDAPLTDLFAVLRGPTSGRS